MKLKAGMTLFSCMFLIGCSSIERASLQSNNPQEALVEVTNLQKELIESNTDVIAKKEYEKGSENLDDAREAINDNEKTSEVLEELAESKAYFLKAQKTARSKSNIPDSIMNARTSAMNAGLLRNGDLREKLADTDDSLRSSTNNFSRDLAPEKLSDFQNKYLNLEVEAVQNEKLGVFRRIITEAEDSNAKKLAPSTYRDAKSNLKIAENLIKQSPREEMQYAESIVKVNESSKLLQDVMDKLKNEAKGSSENVALKLVYQERKLGILSSRVGALKGNLNSTQSKLGQVSQKLYDTETQALSAENKVRFQQAMERVRKSFSDKEAIVYQQGEELVIRLKDIRFKSGSAAIPTTSMSLLSKVGSIVSDLHPERVLIEGHTDATGAKDNNLKLSQKRAKAVQEYLTSLNVKYSLDAKGLGESKPIANNQTSEGRSLNRRVDIIVKANQ